MDAISQSYIEMLVENRINYSPVRASYDGPLGGELINSPNLSVDDHLKAINWSADQINAINNGTYKWKFNPIEADKKIAIANHQALISAHKDQIVALGNQGNYLKD